MPAAPVTREERLLEENARLKAALDAERRLCGEHERTIRTLSERVAVLEVLAGQKEAVGILGESVQ